MNDFTDACMKEAAEMLAEQKRKDMEYCDKITSLADSILETRIKVDELLANQLMDYYALDSTLEKPDVFFKAINTVHAEGTDGALEILIKASDELRLECFKIKTQEMRMPFM
jgi:hypothetical protein